MTPTGDFEIVQHIELLDLPIHVTEHRLRQYLDQDGRIVLPDVPGLSGPIFGPRMLAMIGWLKSRAHCSDTTISTWMEDVLQVPVSRDIRFLLKHPNPETRSWAEELLDRSRRMFSAWHQRDEMTEVGFRRSMIIHRDRFLAIVRNPPDSSEAINLQDRFCIVDVVDGDPCDMSQDYFRFMFSPGVEPTNNHSEQQVRHCVIDRRITQGTRSEAGQRYHERMWSAIATCAKHGRGFFDFLHQSITAKQNRKTHPSLIDQ